MSPYHLKEDNIMQQSEFLDKNIFTDLENQNNGFDKPEIQYFTEADFETLLQRAEYFGLSIYTIKPALDGDIQDEVSHEKAKKKATDPNWYKKAFKTFRKSQEGLTYSATYKVSKKLLAK